MRYMPTRLLFDFEIGLLFFMFRLLRVFSLSSCFPSS